LLLSSIPQVPKRGYVFVIEIMLLVGTQLGHLKEDPTNYLPRSKGE
jgi:hypothetical protein